MNEKFIECARLNLEESAMKYARMKALGRYIENGCDVQVGESDKKDFLELFALKLREAAINLFAEVSLMPLPVRSQEDEVAV